MSSLILFAMFVLAFFALIQGCLLFSADIREEARISANQLRLRRPTLADGVSPWLREILLTAPIRRFDNLVQTCGIAMRTEQVLLGMTIVTVSAVILPDLLALRPGMQDEGSGDPAVNLLLSFASGFGLGAGLPLVVLMRLRALRMTKLTRQLPETLEMIVRSLKAGHPIPACIAMIGKEMLTPIGGEFKRVHDAMSYGLDLRDALSKMTERLHTVPELKYVVSAIKIQSSTGGNLAEILASLATLMRQQQQLKMKVKAISAEGRFSGNILAALPVAVVSLLNIINPEYYVGIMNDPIMGYVMWFAASLVIIGYMLVRRVVNIRI
jgi:tight adherence protein B